VTIATADWYRFGHGSAHGADAVRAKLSRLESATTHVLHSVELGPDERPLDYLVISPAGVFPVSVCDVHGTSIRITNYGLSVDGTGLPILRQAKFGAERVSRLLERALGVEVPARGCVVLLTDAHSPRIAWESRPIGVSVLAKRNVARWLRGQPAVLTPDEVQSAYEAALQLAAA